MNDTDGFSLGWENNRPGHGGNHQLYRMFELFDLQDSSLLRTQLAFFPLEWSLVNADFS